MTADPAYPLFRADALRQGFTVLADYFRHYGIVPPAEWGQSRHVGREMPMHDALDRIAARETWTEGVAIYQSWGEPGKPYRVSAAAGAEA